MTVINAVRIDIKCPKVYNVDYGAKLRMFMVEINKLKVHLNPKNDFSLNQLYVRLIVE